jgi:hypothetical protein
MAEEGDSEEHRVLFSSEASQELFSPTHLCARYTCIIYRTGYGIRAPAQDKRGLLKKIPASTRSPCMRNSQMAPHQQAFVLSGLYSKTFCLVPFSLGQIVARTMCVCALLLPKQEEKLLLSCRIVILLKVEFPNSNWLIPSALIV